jgi:leucyl/phenylalanyl-tRNA---protein transferase
MRIAEGVAILEPGEDFPDGLETTEGFDQNPGLMAVGSDLSPERLLSAYSRGMFPWFSEGEPILWWCTSPRMVLQTKNFKLHRSLRQLIKQKSTDAGFALSVDKAFGEVIRSCSQAPRPGQNGTWISPQIISAYEALHARGVAHSVEVWQDGALVGGLYGLSLGRMFYGESMFSAASGASKMALAALVAMCRERDVPWIDCQQETEYLLLMGGACVPKNAFLAHLKTHVGLSAPALWAYDHFTLFRDTLSAHPTSDGPA